MNYALINSTGLVVNIIVLANVEDYRVDDGYSLVQTAEAGIGYTYVDGAFIAPEPEPVPEPPTEVYTPVRVTKADFQRLFQPTERYALNGLRKQIAALTPEDYTNPSLMLLIAAEDVMFAFEQPAEFIELNHPETYQGLMLLSYLDILTEARVNEIINYSPNQL